MARPPAVRETPVTRPGLLARVLRRIGSALRWLLLSLLLSVLIEWIGMAFWWPEAGLEHSRRMLAAELAFLNDDFRDSLLSGDPARFVGRTADGAYHLLFEVTRLRRASEWLKRAASRSDESPVFSVQRLYRPLADGITAAGQVLKLFMVRLAVLTLAMPAFLLFSLVGLVDGLVQRDLRRWGGGRESSYLYHYAKQSVWGFLVTAWVLYLALPVSVNPAFIIVPFAALFAFSISVTASAFKKYL